MNLLLPEYLKIGHPSSTCFSYNFGHIYFWVFWGAEGLKGLYRLKNHGFFLLKIAPYQSVVLQLSTIHFNGAELQNQTQLIDWFGAVSGRKTNVFYLVFKSAVYTIKKQIKKVILTLQIPHQSYTALVGTVTILLYFIPHSADLLILFLNMGLKKQQKKPKQFKCSDRFSEASLDVCIYLFYLLIKCNGYYTLTA